MSLEFGQQLRAWRGKRYQKEVAEILRIGLSTYVTWERGVHEPLALAMTEVKRIMEANPDKSNAP